MTPGPSRSTKGDGSGLHRGGEPAAHAELVHRPRGFALAAGLAVIALGLVVLALLAHFGVPLLAGAGPGLQAGLLAAGVLSQALIVAGAFAACMAFEVRCSSCNALPREHSVEFPGSYFDRLSVAARIHGPLALLELVDRRPALEGEGGASLDLALCSGCGRCGKVRVSKRVWCPARKRFVVAEETVAVPRSPWVLRQLVCTASEPPAR